MRKLLLLVLAITASVAFASPPVQDEKLPDPALKLPEEITEPTEEHTEAEAAPLEPEETQREPEETQREPEETQRKPEETQREPEETQREPEETQREPEETQREPEETQEETQGMLEEPVLEADYLTEETPETELETELEINAIQTNRNIVPVEEAVAELESETNVEDEKEDNVMDKESPEIQMEPGRENRKTQIGWWSCGGFVLQGKCYQYFTRPLSAYHAEFHCQSICQNGHLASVTNSYVLGEIGRLMDRNGGRTRTWLGGWRIFNTRNFIWLDGAPWTFNGWGAGEPNNAGGQENCVETWYNLAFNDAPCTMPKPFVCSCPL